MINTATTNETGTNATTTSAGIKKDYRKMNIGERIVKIGEIEDKYWEEFEKYGIERVEIK